MITDEGKILHIDFGCAFGQKTKLERLLGLFMDIPSSPFSEDVFIGNHSFAPCSCTYLRFASAMIGREDDSEAITKLWESIKDRMWQGFNAVRIHKNRFKAVGEDKYKHFHEHLLIGQTDPDARQAFDAELEKCYNNRFNAARAFYYKFQQNIVS